MRHIFNGIYAAMLLWFARRIFKKAVQDFECDIPVRVLYRGGEYWNLLIGGHCVAYQSYDSDARSMVMSTARTILAELPGLRGKLVVTQDEDAEVELPERIEFLDDDSLATLERILAESDLVEDVS